MRNINLFVVHCSATKPAMDIGASEIRKWHVDGNGWSDIGYHFVIRRNGALEQGRAVERPGAHCKGHNSQSIGICMVGGVNSSGESENNFTLEQFQTLELIIESLYAKFPGSELLGHRDLSPDADGDGEVEEHEWVKDCPCFDVREWYNSD